MGNEDYALELSRQNLARRVTALEEQLAAAQAQIGYEQERAVHWYGELLCCKEERDRARREAKGVRNVLGLFVDSSEEVIDEVRRLKEQRDELRLNHEELRGERDALEDIVADLKRQLVGAKRNKDEHEEGGE